MVDSDPDYSPEEAPQDSKKHKSSKPRNRPVIGSPDPYNHRHHDPEVARLGIAIEGSIRHFILSQVALSTHIIMWLHVRAPLFLRLLPSQ